MKTDTWMIVIKEDGKTLTPVIRNTEKGRSNYANRMYRKYGDGMKIEQYHFNDDLKIIIDATWGT